MSGKTSEEVLVQKQRERDAREEQNAHDIARIEKLIEEQNEINKTGKAPWFGHIGKCVDTKPALGKVRTHFTKQGFQINKYMKMVGCGYPSDAYDVCDCTKCNEGYSVPTWKISWQ